MLLLIGLACCAGRLLDPRRFRARDVWRPAVTLPAAMVLGAVGVLAGFAPLVGLVAAALVFYALVQLSERPAPLGLGRPRHLGVGRSRSGLLVAGTVALAVWSAWHGLLDHSVLPPPAVGGGG